MFLTSSVTPELLIRQEILALNAYHVPPASGMIKLDAMENPILCPRSCATKSHNWSQKLNQSYPDAGAHQLKTSIAQVTNRAWYGYPAG